MMKKIQEEEKKEQENAERFGNLKLEVLSTKTYYPTLQYPESTFINAVKNAAECNSQTIDLSYDFFHPPKIA